MSYSITNELSQAKQLTSESKFKEAIKVLNKLEAKKGLTLQDQLEIHHLKSFLLIELGDINEALKYAELAYKESLQFKNEFKIVDVLFTMRKALVMDGRENKVLETIIKAEKILNTINQKSSLEFKEKIAYLELNKSRYYFDTGDFNRSLIHADKALAITKEIKNQKLMMFISRLFALNYALKGNFNRAYEYGKRYLTLASKINDKNEIIAALYLIGWNFVEKGDFGQALGYLEQSLSMCDEIDSWWKLPILTHLCELYLNINSLEKAEKCLIQMKKFKDHTDFNVLNSFYRLAEAMILKRKPQESDHLKAKQILKKIVDEEPPFAALLYPALLELCDLYLKDLYETHNLKVLDKIHVIISKLTSIAENQLSFWFLVEVLLLEAKLKLITFEFKEALILLNQALNVAEKYGLTRLIKRITNEQADLSKNFIRWEKMKISGANISERMDLARIDEQIRILLRKRNYLKKVADQTHSVIKI
ncbi:MAG: tetratricopeptide repeat protein [Candidatus Hodarchaeota archaeon]